MNKLTELEKKALKALEEEQLSNDDCFGLIECVTWDGDRKQLGGLITSLQKKGYFESIDFVTTDQRYTQYVLIENAYTVNNLLISH